MFVMQVRHSDHLKTEKKLYIVLFPISTDQAYNLPQVPEVVPKCLGKIEIFIGNPIGLI